MRPALLLVVTATVIFISEILVMAVLHVASVRLGALPVQIEALVDATLLTLIIFPILYGTLLRPMRQEIAHREKTERLLRTAHEGLETQVRERTQALGRANASLRAVMETAHDAVVSANSQGQVIYWNRRAGAMFGYTADEMAGQPLTRIVPERFRDAHTLGLQRVVAGGEAHVLGRMIELIGLHQDGREFPVELSLAQWSVEGQVYFTSIIRDITERKHADDALTAKRRELESMNKVMMGREERILEMKQEVNGLLNELQRTARYRL